MNASPNADAPDASTSRWWPLWGLFCACSWTWVIGMYLPRILLDRYGWAGFVAFLVPNVLGCAALGYVLRTPDRARAIIERHRPWTLAFSFVTVAYHAFFAAFLAARLLPADAAAAGATASANAASSPALLGAGLVLGLAVVAGLLSRLGDRAWLGLAAGTYAVSLTVLAVLVVRPSTLPEIPAVRDGLELATLVPVIVLGFLLCPYLDLTFLRAHRTAPGTHAFGVFGLAFAVMLGLTCVLWFRPAPVLGTWALLHLGLQATFTTGAHLRELRVHARGSAPVRAALLAGPFAIGLGFAAAAGSPVLVGEPTYMRFLAAYGLVFPAAVLWLVARPAAAGEGRRDSLAVLLACLLLAPLYELGFIGRVTGATLPAAGVAAIAIVVVLGRRRRADAAAGEGTDAGARAAPADRATAPATIPDA